MEFKELLLYIENHGLSLIIAVMLLISIYKYFVPFMKESIETQKEMRLFMHNFNSDLLKGKGLEMMLYLKVQELRWSIQKRIIEYIINNNLDKNWDIIVTEINLKLEEKKHIIYMDLREIVSKKLLEEYLNKLSEELNTAKKIIIELLEELKKNGYKDKSLYEVAQRSVETHFEHFENKMHSNIKEIMD